MTLIERRHIDEVDVNWQSGSKALKELIEEMDGVSMEDAENVAQKRGFETFEHFLDEHNHAPSILFEIFLDELDGDYLMRKNLLGEQILGSIEVFEVE